MQNNFSLLHDAVLIRAPLCQQAAEAFLIVAGVLAWEHSCDAQGSTNKTPKHACANGYANKSAGSETAVLGIAVPRFKA